MTGGYGIDHALSPTPILSESSAYGRHLGATALSPDRMSSQFSLVNGLEVDGNSPAPTPDIEGVRGGK